MIPSTVLVLGKQYTVTLIDGTDDDDFGRCDYDNCAIYVRRTQCHQQMADTLLHELNHAIDHAMQNRMTESQVHRAATGNLAVLRDNPALVAFLTA